MPGFSRARGDLSSNLCAFLDIRLICGSQVQVLRGVQNKRIMEIEFQIEKKTSKNGNYSYYLILYGIGKYPITGIDTDEKGRVMIKFPCLYIPSKFKKGLGKNAEGYRQMVEHGSDYGRVEFADEEEWDKLWGNRRLLPKSVEERIDGEMAFVWDKEHSSAWLSRCHRK